MGVNERLYFVFLQAAALWAGFYQPVFSLSHSNIQTPHCPPTPHRSPTPPPSLLVTWIQQHSGPIDHRESFFFYPWQFSSEERGNHVSQQCGKSMLHWHRITWSLAGRGAPAWAIKPPRVPSLSQRDVQPPLPGHTGCHQWVNSFIPQIVWISKEYTLLWGSECASVTVSPPFGCNSGSCMLFRPASCSYITFGYYVKHFFKVKNSLQF